MLGRLAHDISAYLEFGDADAERIRALLPHLRPALPELLDAFYGRIITHPGTARIITGGERQLRRLRAALAGWLDDLLGGTYDERFCDRQIRVGQSHLRIGLPQYYLLTALDTLWGEMENHIRAAAPPAAPPQTVPPAAHASPSDACASMSPERLPASPPPAIADPDAALRSLHKLLTLSAALMLEAYKQTYADEIRATEQAAVRARLDEAEHLAHVGHLAASLAHEIKNPLAGISGAIQVIRESLPGEHPHRPILGEILKQIDRLDGTVKDLLVYARPRPPRFQRCDLNRLIDRVLTVLHDEPEVRKVRIDRVESEKLDLYADEGQLEQLLINLLLNAAQASSAGQVVRLSASSGPDGLGLLIEDHGVGMDDELLRQAFEPFFTTKARGTGLGLPICRRIVEAHGGTIGIHSLPGKRTTVTVRLPRFPPATTGGEELDEYSRANR
jgi:signal transduction histidine kinase